MQLLWKTIWWVLKKLKIELPYDPAIAHLGIYLGKTKILIQKNICTSLFVVSLFIIAKIRKPPKCPLIDEWIKKMWYIYTHTYKHTHNGILAMKK